MGVLDQLPSLGVVSANCVALQILVAAGRIGLLVGLFGLIHAGLLGVLLEISYVVGRMSSLQHSVSGGCLLLTLPKQLSAE